jgi:hypothetical protein
LLVSKLEQVLLRFSEPVSLPSRLDADTLGLATSGSCQARFAEMLWEII